MPGKSSDHILIDHRHIVAVCAGIGEWLRDAMAKESTAIPSHLEALMARLPELDGKIAPSIVPEMPE